MKRFLLPGIYIVSLICALVAAPVLADVPSLQVSPLSYQGALKPSVVESGYVDVANPSDENIQVTSSVQGFRQVNTKGDLDFYSDPVLSNGITVGLSSFQLGPRQAIRVVFNIDPNKLPMGGVYAAIFFRTVPTQQNSENSYVLQSANVGTLLILTNGKASPYRGSISGLSVPFLQLGSGLSGSLGYKNTAASLTAVGFKPSLTTTVFPWGNRTKFQAGLILPGVTRDFSFSRPGSYFGIVPVTVTDSQTGAHATAWVLADTGAYRAGIPGLLMVLFLLYAVLGPKLRHRKQATTPKPQPLDGLSPRLEPAPEPDPEAKPDTDVVSREAEGQESEIEPEPVEPESKLEELASETLESDAGLDLEVPEPKPKKVKVASTKLEKTKAKPKPKTQAKKSTNSPSKTARKPKKKT